MLSGETANGAFPKSAVEIMARTCMEAEALQMEMDPTGQDELFRFIRLRKEAEEVIGHVSHAEAAASTAVKIAGDIGAKAIIVISETGETARLLAKFHPNATILAICSDTRVARQIEGYMCNAVAVTSNIKRGDRYYSGAQPSGAHVRLAFEKGKEFGLFNVGDEVPVVHTIRTDQTNLKEWSTRILNVLPSKGKYDVKPSAAASAEASLPKTTGANVAVPTTNTKKASTVIDDVFVEPIKKNCVVH